MSACSITEGYLWPKPIHGQWAQTGWRETVCVASVEALAMGHADHPGKQAATPSETPPQEAPACGSLAVPREMLLLGCVEYPGNAFLWETVGCPS